MQTAPVLGYIRTHWDRTLYRDANGSGFQGEDLPYPYTSPCIKGQGHFYFFFYWDTYFTNAGLLAHGRHSAAKDNIRNILWLVERQGYMPNHVAITNRSQPPYLCQMVRDYLAATGDSAFLREAAQGVRAEHHFWTTARSTPTGLTRHGHHDTAEGCALFHDGAVTRRMGWSNDIPLPDKVRIGGHFLAEAETGWDFNPRFQTRCLDHNPCDLNGLLYGHETWLAEASETLGWGDAPRWRKLAALRRERIDRHLWSQERGLYLDFDFVHGRHSPIASLAAFLPLFTGAASPEQAARVRAALPLFEREHGLAVTEASPSCRGYQWAYPNAWPPLTFIAVQALRRYGFDEEARRIARKFIATTVRLFEKTGQLWEKTDAETGEVAGGEYTAAPMLGWTAGTFVVLEEWLHPRP